MTQGNDPRRPGSGKIRLGEKYNSGHSSDRTSNIPYSTVAIGLGVVFGAAAAVYGWVMPAVHSWSASSSLNESNVAVKQKIGAPTSDLIVTSRVNDDGEIVGAGKDFAIQVSVYEQGKLKVWLTEGPYAGTEIDVYPANPDKTPGGVVAFTKFADLKSEDAGKRFVPRGEAAETTKYALTGDAVTGVAPKMPFVVPDYKDIVQKVSVSGRDDGAAFAFAMNAEPKDMSKFSIRMWNNDLYAFDLSKNAYYIKSTYLNTPTWKVGETQRRVVAQSPAPAAPAATPAMMPLPQIRLLPGK